MDIKKFSEALAKHMIKYRSENNLTTRQFAAEAGLSHYLVCKLELGRAKPASIGTISKVLKVMGKTLTLDIE